MKKLDHRLHGRELFATEKAMNLVHIGALHRFRKDPGPKEVHLMARMLIRAYLHDASVKGQEAFSGLAYFRPDRPDNVLWIPMGEDSLIIAMQGEMR